MMIQNKILRLMLLFAVMIVSLIVHEAGHALLAMKDGTFVGFEVSLKKGLLLTRVTEVPKGLGVLAGLAASLFTLPLYNMLAVKLDVAALILIGIAAFDTLAFIGLDVLN